MQVKLSNATVTLKDELSWGDTEQIKAILTSSLKIDANARKQIENSKDGENIDINEMSINGEAVLESKIKAAELLITEIVREGEETAIKFSKKWLMGLSRADGDLLMAEVDKIRADAGATENTVGK